MINYKRKLIRTALVVALLPLAACGDLLDVESPGRIADENLNDDQSIPGLVSGMKYDLSQAMDGSMEFLALASLELWHGGSYDWSDIPRGIIPAEDVGTVWNSPQQARWVAENGLERMRDLLGEDDFVRNRRVALAYLYAGFANRMLGEYFCSSVIDGGEEIPNTDHFTRGMDHFSQAITIGQAAGESETVNAAYAGRATMKAWTGDWTGAAQDAANVPTSFVFNAEVDTELRNELAYETHDRPEYTVWGTIFADHYGDPRIPWDTVYEADGSIARGANGSTLHFRQEKYPENGSDIPLVKGTEMLVLRAEAALRSNNMGQAYTLMNQARAHYGMDPLEEAASMDAAWEDLMFERQATLWLEGRGLWDYRRWYDEGRNDFLADRDRCIPISETERDANPNLG